MTGGSFLGRWSRLKRSEKKAEAATPREPETEDRVPAPTGAGDAAPTEEAAEIAAEDLPKIEDLTAESDLAAFMKAGVPKALRAAAMRRAWSLDPAIRDYVGPAEYAWDFNDPTAMHGFAGGTTTEEFGRAIRSLTGADETAEPSPLQVRADAPGQAATVPASPAPRHGGSDTSAAEAEATSPQGEDARSEPHAYRSAGAPEAAERPEDEAAVETPTRRHGGAIPK